MPSSKSPRENRLLAMLPPPDYRTLLPALERVHLGLGTSVVEPGCAPGHVYFPTRGIVSLVYVTATGDPAQLAMVGCEGMVGVAVFMGGETMTHRAVVQSPCSAYRLPARLIKSKFAEGGALQLVLLRFTQSLITQISHTAVCNLHHSVEQQLCRSLLNSFDRNPSNELHMTHEVIANMLGVRRQTVTEVARRLEHIGLITHSRGLITILDRAGLIARACECYRVVRKEMERLLPCAYTGVERRKEARYSSGA
jgi:CRP-like cAMP-binding protein